MKTILFFVTFAFSTLALAADKSEPRAFIIQPVNNAVVESPVTVKFGLENMEISPAGVEHANGGHHHLLIDTPLPADLTLPIAMDDKHIHFGKGQTETTLELASGKHTLQLLLGDHLHRPHSKPVYSDVITITVKEKQ
jgi:hypothetical protein